MPPLLAAAGAFLATGTGAAVAAAGIGAAGSIYASNQANSAQKKAITAQQQAADKQLQLQQQQYDQTRADQAPYRTTGYSALDALSAKYGLGGGSSTPTGGQVGKPDYGAYVAQNPDIAAEAQRVLAADPNSIGDLNGDGAVDATDYGQYHAQTFHDRNVPQGQSPDGQVQTESDLQTQIGQEPTFAPRQDYQRPGYQQADVGLDKFQASPDYNFRLQEGSRNLNAFNAAKGVLGSGAAGKALVDYGQNTAAAEYGNWRGYVTGQTDKQNDFNQNAFQSDRAYGTDIYNTDRSNALNRYDTNRSYLTGRDDTRTQNLFNLAGMGQGATGATNAAGSAYANNSGNILQNNANSVSNAFSTTAANNNSTAGSLVGFGQQLANAFGGGGYKPVSSVANYGASTVAAGRPITSATFTPYPSFG